MKMLVAKIVDLLLRLVPGSRFNPDSLESRVRRVSDAASAVIEAAIDAEIAARASVHADAVKGAEAARAAEAAAATRAKALEALVKKTTN